MEKTRDFTEGSILTQLLRFGIPVLFAMLLQALYGAADLLVVGQFAQAADVSAVSTGSQVLHTVTGIITGLSMGITVLVGQKIGEKRPEQAGASIGSGIVMFAVLGLFLTTVMVFGAEAISSVMKAPGEAFSQTAAYVRICSFGLIFIIAYNVLGSIFRGIGDSRMPLITVAIASVFNVAGDLLFVAAFRMGAAGAALATVMAQASSVLLSFLIIRKRSLPFTFKRESLRPDGTLIRKILSLGVPIALQDLLVSVSFLVIMAIVNSMGVIASAGVGVAEKLCSFVMLVPSSFMQSMSAFVAQNIGAKKEDRAKKALFYGIAASLTASVFLAYFSFFHGDVMSAVFTKDDAVILQAHDYLKAYAIDCLLTSFMFCFVGYFNGCGNTLFVMIQGIVGAFGIRIPVAYLMSRTAGATLFRIGLATPSSTAVQIALCLIFYMKENPCNIRKNVI